MKLLCISICLVYLASQWAFVYYTLDTNLAYVIPRSELLQWFFLQAYNLKLAPEKYQCPLYFPKQ